jgi:oxygen-dependent protoporphyrinogen oxidase
MSNASYPHIVIGGGISGLGSAHYAVRQGVETLVLERAPRVGGCMHTHRFDDRTGFWVEAGSHSCFNSYGNLLGILEDLNLMGAVTAKEKRSYLLYRGGARKRIIGALHPLELVGSLPRLFRLDKSRLSVADYYGAGLGRKNYRDLFGPAFRSVICQDADDFPAEALFRKKPRRKDVLRSFTMPGGLNDIPSAIAQQPDLTVRTGVEVASVGVAGDGFEVLTDDGERLGCERLTLAVPPDIGSRLLAETAPRAAVLIGEVGVAEIDSQLLLFDAERLELPEFAGLISVDGPFLSAVSRDFLPDARYRGFAFHFPGDRLDEPARIAAACTALSTSPEQVVSSTCVRNRLPSLRQGHQALVEQLDRALAGTRIAVTGNWFLGVSIEDCLTRSRGEHERLFAVGAR